jgi:uncharacterized protein YycO
MVVDAIRHFKVPSFTYNHSLVYVQGKVYEAVDEGVVCVSLDEHYSHDKYKRGFDKIEVTINLTREQERKALEYLKEQVGKKYEFSNFLFHPIKTIVGSWIGSTTDSRQYCHELTIRALNASGAYNLDPFLNPREIVNVLIYNTWQ